MQRLLTLALVPAALLAAPLAAQAQAPRVTWWPERPAPGSLIRLTVAAGADSSRLEAELAGQPVHFERQPDRSLRGYAGIPTDAPDSIPLLVRQARDGGVDSMRVPIPVRVDPAPATSSGGERLRVPERFTRVPDPATAARMERERALAMAVARGAHLTPRMWEAPFILPRESRVTSRFGSGRTFNGALQSRHGGVDLAGAVGAPVRAANHGIVALVADFLLAGTAVYIDHGGGLVTGYFHLSEATVAQGDTVRRGDRIGKVGATGRVTGPHLHWMARYGEVTVDPMSVVRTTGRREAGSGDSGLGVRESGRDQGVGTRDSRSRVHAATSR